MGAIADAYLLVILLLDSTLRVATPLILAALAGLFAERSGVVDIGLEGKMLAAAFASATVASFAGSPWLGLAAGILVSVCFAVVHGFACVTHHGNQVVSGVAINTLIAGITPVLGNAWFRRGGQTPTLDSESRFTAVHLPFADAVADVPIIGPLYSELLSGHNIIVYAALGAVPLTAWIVFRTRFGLRLRAVGENPAAVDTAGVAVAWMRYRALLVGGVLCGVAGTYLSTAQNASFVRDMTAGKGYLALAALIFAKWRPLPVLFACLLFGFLEAVEARLQGVVLPVIGAIPVQFIQALPYVLTVVLLAGFVGRAIPPRAIGVPYIKER